MSHVPVSASLLASDVQSGDSINSRQSALCTVPFSKPQPLQLVSHWVAHPTSNFQHSASCVQLPRALNTFQFAASKTAPKVASPSGNEPVESVHKTPNAMRNSPMSCAHQEMEVEQPPYHYPMMTLETMVARRQELHGSCSNRSIALRQVSWERCSLLHWPSAVSRIVFVEHWGCFRWIPRQREHQLCTRSDSIGWSHPQNLLSKKSRTTT